MRYHTIDELDQRIEKIIRKTVESYYTDWKNYDRPKYMKLKGSADRSDKHLILIVRKCGTYLLTEKTIKTYESTKAIFEYYQTQEGATYYSINLDALTIDKIDPETYVKEIRHAA